MPHRWTKAAELRRDQIESGLDITFNRVFVPFFLNCVEQYRPRSILEVGCGTGHLAARLAGACPHVEALEPSPGMHAVATAVLGKSPVRLHCSSVESFRPKHRFDLVVSHLCVHVVADVDRFCRACSSVMATQGLFVFSLPHPCFWNDYKEFFSRLNYRYVEERFASVTWTITKDAGRPIDGVPFHHRPLGRYVTALARCGMALKQLDEIVPSAAVQKLYGQEWKTPRYCALHAIRVSLGYCSSPDGVCAALQIDGGANYGPEEPGEGEGSIGEII
jgi:SAM-dependent methyltransferase